MGTTKQAERGIALVMVLWIFMILTILVAQFGRRMRNDTIATRNLAEDVQARGVALAGMNRALYRALREREQDPGDLEDNEEEEVDEAGEPKVWIPDGRWHEGTYGGGSYAVRLVDEGGRIPLNRAGEAVLRRVFENLGFDLDAQEEIVDAILDWRDVDDLTRLHGAEEDYYLGLREPYRPKNGPFDSVDELVLVRGITRELVYGPPAETLDPDAPPPIALADIFSVFNRSATINVRTASPAVLEVLIGDEEDQVADIVTTREEGTDSILESLKARVGDRQLARRLVERTPTTLTIEVRAGMQQGHLETRLGAVVDIDEDADGFQVVRWLDRLPAF